MAERKKPRMSEALKVAGVPGFEPGNGEIKTRCLTAWRYSNKELAGIPGFEPGNGEIKTRCLTAWRYPNEICMT